MQLFLIGLNIFLVLFNGALAGRFLAKGKKTTGYLNLFCAVIWSCTTMLNVLSLYNSC